MQNKYDAEPIQVEQFTCAGHSFCRVSLEIGRWHRSPHESCFVSEEIIAEGVAKRTRSDRNDDYVGDNLALCRALDTLSAKVRKRAMGKVKHNDDMKEQRAKRRERRVASRVVFGIDMASHVEPVEMKNIEVVAKFLKIPDQLLLTEEEEERLIDEC